MYAKQRNWILFPLLFLIATVPVVLLPPETSIKAALVAAIAFAVWHGYVKSRMPNHFVHAWIRRLDPEWELDSFWEYLELLPSNPTLNGLGQETIQQFHSTLANRLSQLLTDSTMDPVALRENSERCFRALNQLDNALGTTTLAILLEELVDAHVQDMRNWERFPFILEARSASIPTSIPLNGKLAVLRWAPVLQSLATTVSFDARIRLFYQQIGKSNPFDSHQQAAIFLQLIERKLQDDTVSDATALRVASMFRTYWGFLASCERQFVMQMGVVTSLGAWMAPVYLSYLSEFDQYTSAALLARAGYPEELASEVLKSVYY